MEPSFFSILFAFIFAPLLLLRAWAVMSVYEKGWSAKSIFLIIGLLVVVSPIAAMSISGTLYIASGGNQVYMDQLVAVEAWVKSSHGYGPMFGFWVTAGTLLAFLPKFFTKKTFKFNFV